HVAPYFPQCLSVGLAEATLEWRLAGASSWSSLPMHEAVPGKRSATIPAQAEGAVVEYRVHAVDRSGRDTFAPAANFDTQPFSFPVISTRPIFFDDFEADRGWTHRRISPSSSAVADDWERGTPQGKASDPTGAFSGTNVWGTDLGDHGSGNYPDGIENRLESPAIDCTHASGVRLRFRRWLNVQEAPGDEAFVLVNGHVVWTNPTGEDTRDHEWRFEEIDIAPFADGRSVRIGFGLKTGNYGALGGWNVDDVEVVATGSREPVASCRVGAAPRATPLALALGGAALAAVCAVRRRRFAR
ncbi:MAG TPA: hypothetical protein VMV18_03835, partial [bacterium]|nr:hypothetical protein [bacterium]